MTPRGLVYRAWWRRDLGPRPQARRGARPRASALLRSARSSRGRGGTDVAGRIGALSLERGGGARRRPLGRAAVDAGAVVAGGGEREVKEMRGM